MTPSDTHDARLIPVHIGFRGPAWMAEMEAMGRIARMAALANSGPSPRPALCEDAFPWASLGIEPRWVDRDTSDCVAAIEPGADYGAGGEQIWRLVAGARGRGEQALLLSTLGSGHSTIADQVPVDDFGFTVLGRQLPEGVRPQLADELDESQRDLGLRLLNDSPQRWWAIEFPADSDVEARADFTPILRTSVGETVAAQLLLKDYPVRWFLIPPVSRWPMIVAWLVERALPAYVPGALRRARQAHLVDDDLLTSSELEARQALQRFEEDAAERRATLEQALQAARESGDAIRHGLLYGFGRKLVIAVKEILELAGFDVEDLDATHPSESADLLVEIDGRHLLLEAKSATGMPSESLVDDLRRHLRTWPELDTRPIEAGVLVVNYQRNLPPGERAAAPYARPEFVGSLDVGVISSLTIFRLWRNEQWQGIIRAIVGD